MNIQYFANASVPSRSANSVHIMKMCEALAEAGHSVELRIPNQGLSALADVDPFAWYGVKPVFTLRKVPWMFRHPRGVTDLLWVLATGGLILLNRLRGHRPASSTPHTSRGVIDVCLTRNPWAGLLFPRLGIPTILELHAPIAATGRLGALYRLTQGFHHRRLLRVVVITQALRTLYVQAGAPPSKIRVLHDAVDVEKYPDPLYSDRRQGLIVGYIGSLHAGKGMEILTRLAASNPGNTYHVYGGTPEDIQRLRRISGLFTNVHFYGHVAPAEVPALLNGFDVVLMPYLRRVSVSGNYGDVAPWMSPLKMFEYMAAGRAILSSDLPVLREVLEDGRNAVLADPDDPGAWELAMGRLADPALRRLLGQAARAEAVERFSWRERAKRMLSDL